MTARRETTGELRGLSGVKVGRAGCYSAFSRGRMGAVTGDWLLAMAAVLTVPGRATTSSLSIVISRLAWSGFCGCDGGRVSLLASVLGMCVCIYGCTSVRV